MNETQQDAPELQPTKTPPPVYSLAQLNELCRKKMRVEMDFCGTNLAIECLRLSPSQDAALSEIVDVVTPPIIKGKTPEDDRANYTDAEYLKRKAKAEQQARALGLYWCVPAFAAEKPGLTDPKAILDFVQAQLNEQILATLYRAIKYGGVKTADLVNFT